MDSKKRLHLRFSFSIRNLPNMAEQALIIGQVLRYVSKSGRWPCHPEGQESFGLLGINVDDPRRGHSLMMIVIPTHSSNTGIKSNDKLINKIQDET